jgi:hypothetical protein
VADSIDKFYDDLQTVPKLIRDLALGVAEAQRALDHDYLLNLAEFTKVVRSVVSPDPKSPIPAAEYISLFKAMAPSRHQFTETTAEVHADLQMASSSEINVGGSFGLKAAIFAVAVNASYTRKNAYNFQAAATIKTIIHAVPADPGVMEKLLARAASVPGTQQPADQRWQSIATAFKGLFDQVPSLRLASLSQDSVKVGTVDLTLTLTGAGFTSDAKVQFRLGASTTALDAKLNPAGNLETSLKGLLTSAGKAEIFVTVSSAVSNSLPFEITA